MEEAVSYKIEPYTYDGILEVELIGTARDNEFKR